MSDTYKNIKYCNNVTLSVTEAMSTYCMEQSMDAENPVCARLTVLGKMVAVTNAVEKELAKKALFSRHPSMAKWPSSHGRPSNILVI